MGGVAGEQADDVGERGRTTSGQWMSGTMTIQWGISGGRRRRQAGVVNVDDGG